MTEGYFYPDPPTDRDRSHLYILSVVNCFSGEGLPLDTIDRLIEIGWVIVLPGAIGLTDAGQEVVREMVREVAWGYV